MLNILMRWNTPVWHWSPSYPVPLQSHVFGALHTPPFWHSGSHNTAKKTRKLCSYICVVLAKPFVTHQFHNGHPHILYHCSYMCLVDYKHLHSDILGHIQLKKSKKWSVKVNKSRMEHTYLTLVPLISCTTAVTCVGWTTYTSILTLWVTYG